MTTSTMAADQKPDQSWASMGIYVFSAAPQLMSISRPSGSTRSWRLVSA